MNITLGQTERFKCIVEDLIRRYNSAPGGLVTHEIDVVTDLYARARDESERFVGARGTGVEHRTGVCNTQIDFKMIMMSIIAISWAVRMRRIKSVEGQCHVHTNNCDVTRAFHRETYDAWVAVIEELLTVLKSDRPPATT